MLSFKRPLLSVDVSVCLSVCLQLLMLNISETKRFTGSCPIEILCESAYGASIGLKNQLIPLRSLGEEAFGTTAV